MFAMIHRFRLPNLIRFASMRAAASKSESETKLGEILKQRFPTARLIDVKDTSCNYCRVERLADV
jgi:hypothetical protein